MKVIDLLESSPVIAAVKDDKGMERCFQSESSMVFVLYGTICNIADIENCYCSCGFDIRAEF